MNTAHRKILLSGLLGAFVLQTSLVYADDTAERLPRLSPLALEGRALWHEHNCQVCHQLFGFGGFLGPDLTNVASRAGRERFDAVLTAGSRQMPAFALSPASSSAAARRWTSRTSAASTCCTTGARSSTSGGPSTRASAFA